MSENPDDSGVIGRVWIWDKRISCM